MQGVAAEPDQNDQREHQRPARRAIAPEGAFLKRVGGRGLGGRFPARAGRVALGDGRRRSGVVGPAEK